MGTVTSTKMAGTRCIGQYSQDRKQEVIGTKMVKCTGRYSENRELEVIVQRLTPCTRNTTIWQLAKSYSVQSEVTLSIIMYCMYRPEKHSNSPRNGHPISHPNS